MPGWKDLKRFCERDGYQTGTYGAMGGARAVALPLPYESKTRKQSPINSIPWAQSVRSFSLPGLRLMLIGKTVI